jgi:ketosteroid isomerase-like protein
MKVMCLAVLSGLLVSSLVASSTEERLVTEIDEAARFQEFLRKFEEGTGQFINGDATLWKQHVSQRDDATIMGGFGGYEQGKDVGPRYDWAAAQFRPSGAILKVEYLSTAVSGDLAYTVTIERSQVLVTGQAAPMPMALRVSHVFRKENGAWKLLHRHADHLVEKTAPGAVLRR